MEVEYYEHGGSAVAQVGWTAGAGGGACPIGQYRAEYFNNISLSGTPVFQRCETAIAYDWGAAGPGNGVGSDNFSVRWTGQFAFAAGSHVFGALGDDGFRISVDGALIIDAWQDQAATTSLTTVSLTAGTHEVKVEYYEHGGSALLQVGWQ